MNNFYIIKNVKYCFCGIILVIGEKRGQNSTDSFARVNGVHKRASLSSNISHDDKHLKNYKNRVKYSTIFKKILCTLIWDKNYFRAISITEEYSYKTLSQTLDSVALVSFVHFVDCK